MMSNALTTKFDIRLCHINCSICELIFNIESIRMDMISYSHVNNFIFYEFVLIISLSGSNKKKLPKIIYLF